MIVRRLIFSLLIVVAALAMPTVVEGLVLLTGGALLSASSYALHRAGRGVDESSRARS